ncbi:MAG: phosphoribosyltransferase [Myxococcales bacterium]|nr:phosphoribosyltransferase [Myxococcales bacterium]
MSLFLDRRDAGERLAEALQPLAGRSDVLVLALPRGGVPVGYEIATRLGLPLDVLVVRKLGVPGHEELAMGAIASGGALVINRDVVGPLGISEAMLQRVIARERAELERRERAFRDDRPPIDVTGKTVLLVDDGLATGSTMLAAVRALRARPIAGIMVAVPVAAPDVCEQFRREVDQIVCLATPEPFYGVGLWYDDFSQTTDEEVRELLERAAREQPTSARATAGASSATTS